MIWALNITVTKYILTHGLQPLAYADDAYFARDRALRRASRTGRERSFRIARARRQARASLAAAMIFLNQLCFVYARQARDRVDGRADPRHDADLHGADLARARARAPDAALLDRRRVSRSAASRSSPLGDGGGRRLEPRRGRCSRSASRRPGPRTRSSIAPLMRALLAVPDQRARARDRLGAARARQRSRSSPTRTSSSAGSSGSASRFAVVGPLVLTNILWFTAIDRVGAVARVALREPPAVPRRALRARPALGVAARAADRRRRR